MSNHPVDPNQSRSRRDRSHYQHATPALDRHATDVSADDLNVLSAQAAAAGRSYDPSMARQAAVTNNGSVSHAPPDGSRVIGTFSYRFPVGSDRTWHAFAGSVRMDGTVDSQAYQWDGRGWTNTTLLPPQDGELRRIGREQVTAQYAVNQGAPVAIAGDLTKAQINRVSDAHARWLLELDNATKGNATAEQACRVLENYSERALGWIQSHGAEADRLLHDPNYMRGAEQYRVRHPDTALSQELGRKGVVMPRTAPTATGAPCIPTTPARSPGPQV